MTVSATAPNTASQGAATSNIGSAVSSTRNNVSDYQTFLKMLTTQMKNQDPLNPIESSDYAVQLATFSGVEQQVLTNQLLTSLASRMGLSELSGWVGMEALTAAPAFFSGEAMDLVPSQAPLSDQTAMIVRNSFGNEVARQDIALGSTQISFNGVGDDGYDLPTGWYSFEMISTPEGGPPISSPVLSYARIQEARSDSGSVMLVFEGGGRADSADVVGLRSPA
jgi:flagellar basal-body rod modification protein FlgD